MENRTVIHVALAFDQNYINQFYALSTSIFLNNRKNSIAIHAITSGLNEEDKQEIISYFKKFKSTIAFYSVPSDFGKGFKLKNHWTLATYYRLLLPELLPDSVGKYIYLDTDILVVNDLAELFEKDISLTGIAAVRDRLVGKRPDLGIDQDLSYFNAGVLLVNKKLWITEGITEKVLHFLAGNPDSPYLEQDALNYIFKDRWLKLDTKFNLMYSEIPEGYSKKEYNNFIRDKVVIHFTQHRPWNMLCRNPYRSLYQYYLKLTPIQLNNKYIDYSSSKIPQFIKIRLVEAYFNLPLVKKMWQSIKGLKTS